VRPAPVATALLPLLIACLLALSAALFAAPAFAQSLQPVPALTARVIDRSGTLSAPQQQALEGKLAAFEAAHGSQIVVLLVPTTQPEDITAFAFRVADAWKIGRREVGDGILIVVAKEDRKVRIEVARTLEGRYRTWPRGASSTASSPPPSGAATLPAGWMPAWRGSWRWFVAKRSPLRRKAVRRMRA
jgi:Beta-propeller domains of methanol dehydrogenase type